MKGLMTRRFEINRGDYIEEYPRELVKINNDYCIGQFIDLDNYKTMRFHNLESIVYKDYILYLEHIRNDKSNYLGNIYKVVGFSTY